jgi:hypothetical protein
MEPINTPPNLFMIPAGWTEGVLYDKGGDSPPVWWSAPPTFEDVGFWKFDGTPVAYPHTIIYTGANALPVGQAVFNWTIEEASSIPFWFIYRFSATGAWTIMPFSGSPGDTGEFAVFLPGGLDLGQNPPFDDADDPQPPYFEWGVLNTTVFPDGSLPAAFEAVLLLHCDGDSASTDFIDSSLNKFTVTPSGGADITDTNPKFGSGALNLEATTTDAGDYISVPIVPGGLLDILSGDGDFTIEFWVNSEFTNGVILDYGDSHGSFGNPGNDQGVYFQMGSQVVVNTSIPGWAELASAASTLLAGEWNHVALVRFNSVVKVYVNGSATGGTMANDWTDFTLGSTNPSFFTVGWSQNVDSAVSPSTFDEIRVSNIAQYTANFTPTGPFEEPIDLVWEEGQVNVSVYSDQFNCECDSDNSTYATLAELRLRMMYRLGYAAMANTPPPGMVGLLNEFLQDAQRLLYRSYKELRTERFFKWTMGIGQRYYGIYNNEDGCLRKLDPYKVTWVGFQDLNLAWYPLIKGIDPVLYTRAQITVGWPSNYEIRSCIEIFPAPRANYTLFVRGHFGLDPFTDDADRTTIDDEAVFLMALGNAKAHYKQQDSGQVLSQALGYVRNLVAGSHLTARYIPRTEVQRPMTPPLFLPLLNK